jgi:hypothetical protein
MRFCAVRTRLGSGCKLLTAQMPCLHRSLAAIAW